MVDYEQQDWQDNSTGSMADYTPSQEEKEMNLQEALAVITYMNGHSPWSVYQDPIYRKAWQIIRVNAERVAEHGAQ